MNQAAILTHLVRQTDVDLLVRFSAARIPT
jgi:hypothetical protein